MGFPTRHTRTAFGPTFENASKIRVPKYQRSAESVNRSLFQVAGMNNVTPLAWIELSWDTVTLNVPNRAEAWNPEGILTGDYALDGSPSRGGVGVYTVNYQAQYPDELDAAQTIGILDGHVHIQNPTAGYVYTATFTIDDANSFTVRIYEWQIGVSTDWAASDKDVRVYWW